LLKPVDKVLEWILVLVVEEVTSWLDLDELFHDVLLWNVRKDDILRVLRKHGESVWNTSVVLILLNFKNLLELVKLFNIEEFRMLSHLSE
jgi:hypothetical protein